MGLMPARCLGDGSVAWPWAPGPVIVASVTGAGGSLSD